MRTCVLSLTRDRIDYSRACFATLRANAGCEFDHVVLDQGSTDGTADWLVTQPFTHVVLADRNMGISRGHNHLLNLLGDDYDAVVTVDNDCEVTMPGTLRTVAEAAAEGTWIVSPTVLGLIHPLSPQGEHRVAGHRIGVTGVVGGICRGMSGKFARKFRFNENNPLWGGDEHDLPARFPGRVGWLLDWTVNHYRTTVVQNAEQAPYYARKLKEMGIAE